MILSQGDNNEILIPIIFIVVPGIPVVVNQNIY